MRKNRTFAGVLAATTIAGAIWSVTVPVSTSTLGGASPTSLAASVDNAVASGDSVNSVKLNSVKLNSVNSVKLNSDTLA